MTLFLKTKFKTFICPCYPIFIEDDSLDNQDNLNKSEINEMLYRVLKYSEKKDDYMKISDIVKNIFDGTI